MTLANLVQQTAGEAGAVDAQQGFRHLHCSAGKQATRGFAESRWLRAVKQLRRSAAFRVYGSWTEDADCCAHRTHFSTYEQSGHGAEMGSWRHGTRCGAGLSPHMCRPFHWEAFARTCDLQLPLPFCVCRYTGNVTGGRIASCARPAVQSRQILASHPAPVPLFPR